MVKAACGRFLTKTGVILSQSGKAFPTFTCNGYDFVMENGKVAKSEKKNF
jgi:hypothetical protein